MEYELICQVCKKPIADKAGYLWLDMIRVNTVQRAWEVAEAKKVAEAKENGSNIRLIAWGGGELMAMPGRVKWQAHHEKCDPDIEADSYTIEAHRIRTPKMLLEWTAHLMDKNWITHTNWTNLLYGVYNHGILRQKDGD